MWDPLSDAAESRTSIIDPLTGQSRPVVGVTVAYASAVGAGGAAFLLPNQWNMLHRLRTIPDSVEDFTGFMISGDLVAWSFPGAEGASRYRSKGTANVRNVTLPATYNHIFVTVTQPFARQRQDARLAQRLLPRRYRSSDCSRRYRRRQRAVGGGRLVQHQATLVHRGAAADFGHA